MELILAIHERGDSFDVKWSEYCDISNIEYIKVDIFSNDLLARLRESKVNAFLFNLPINDLKTQLFAANISRTIALMGIKVFPCDSSHWHFDDKVAQKYLFESLGVPMCPTWVFYDKNEALEWVSTTKLPKVFKLRRGAGSYNVQLIESASQARSIVEKMFGAGIKPVSTIFADYKTKYYKHKNQRDWLQTLKRLPGTLTNIYRLRTSLPREKGYVYFQEFFAGNDHDTRVTVIGNRAFAFRRFTRPGDFRASGSGRISWDPESIDMQCIRIAFEASRCIGSQCMAFDFVYDPSGNPIILEVCYSFIPQAVYDCPGYWDSELNFQGGHVWPQDAIISDLIKSLEQV